MAQAATGATTNWRRQVSVTPPHEVVFRPQQSEDGVMTLVGQIQINNQSSGPTMFKVKTTMQDSYYVRPNLGIIDAKQQRSVTFIFRRPLGGEVSCTNLPVRL